MIFFCGLKLILFFNQFGEIQTSLIEGFNIGICLFYTYCGFLTYLQIVDQDQVAAS